MIADDDENNALHFVDHVADDNCVSDNFGDEYAESQTTADEVQESHKNIVDAGGRKGAQKRDDSKRSHASSIQQPKGNNGNNRAPIPLPPSPITWKKTNDPSREQQRESSQRKQTNGRGQSLEKRAVADLKPHPMQKHMPSATSEQNQF